MGREGGTAERAEGKEHGVEKNGGNVIKRKSARKGTYGRAQGCITVHKC